MNNDNTIDSLSRKSAAGIASTHPVSVEELYTKIISYERAQQKFRQSIWVRSIPGFGSNQPLFDVDYVFARQLDSVRISGERNIRTRILCTYQKVGQVEDCDVDYWPSVPCPVAETINPKLSHFVWYKEWGIASPTIINDHRLSRGYEEGH